MMIQQKHIKIEVYGSGALYAYIYDHHWIGKTIILDCNVAYFLITKDQQPLISALFFASSEMRLVFI